MYANVSSKNLMIFPKFCSVLKNIDFYTNLESDPGLEINEMGYSLQEDKRC